MAKKFYTILKTDLAVNTFNQNFELIKNTFTGLEEAFTIAATKPDSNTDLSALRSAAIERLEKIVGITRSSLTYAENHKDDGLSKISADSKAILKSIQTETKAELETLEFLFEQAEDLHALTQIAAGTASTASNAPTLETVSENNSFPEEPAVEIEAAEADETVADEV